MGDLLGSPRVAFLFFDFGRFDSQTVVNILRASIHSSIRSQRGRAARGEAVKLLRGAGARGPRVASARRGTGIRGRMGASMSDAIIPALKHRSHQNSEVKRAWGRVVLGWVTSWEVLVLHSFFFRFRPF